MFNFRLLLIVLLAVGPLLAGCQSEMVRLDSTGVLPPHVGRAPEGRDLSKYPVAMRNGRRVRIVPASDYLLWRDVPVPPAPSGSGVSIAVGLADQRAWLFEDGVCVLTAPISPGSSNKKTPTGLFRVISKHEDWVSTTYHTPMPYFLRINADGGRVGIHQGKITYVPASHGCIRLPEDSAREFFDRTPVGSLVLIF